MGKKKILVIIDNLGGGGAEKILITLLKNISPEKYWVDLYLISKEGIYINEVPSWVKMRYFFPRPSNQYYLIVIKAIKRLFLHFPKLFYVFFLYKKAYDIEIGFREGFSTKIILSSTNKKSLKISWLHTDIIKHHFWFINKKKYFTKLKKIDKVICVSKTTKEIFLSRYPCFTHKTKTIYNPINVEEITKKGEATNANLFNNSENNLVTIGRLDEGKNHQFLIKCVAKLYREGIETHLWIIGGGELDYFLKELAIKENVESLIHFVGFTPNPYGYLKQASLFVFASRYEGLPTVLIEAMALEKTIISTYCNGAEEILEDGKYGILCKEDIHDFTNHIKKCLTNSITFEVSNKLSDFNIKSQISKIEQILDGN
tara:strand:- start:5760 stop:6875 length:1116 start_codon:yes stop_codon:yes gene_type:complete